MDKPRPFWSSRTKIVVIFLLLGLGVFLLFRFSLALKPLVLAVILAYVLSPLVTLFQNRLRIPRGLSALLAYLILFVVLITIPLVVIPPLSAQSTGLNLDIQRFLIQVQSMLANQVSIAGQIIDVEAIFQQVINSLQGLVEPAFGQTLGLAIELISSFVWVIFILVVSFYLIKDGRQLLDWLERITPSDYRQDMIRLGQDIHQIWGAFFRGQMILAVIVAAIFTASGFALGLPFALAMGVFAGLLEFLPSIGHGIWLAVAAFLALFAGSTWLHIPNWAFMLLIVGLHLFYQQFDLNYLIPRVIGRSVHLHPLVVILGIVGGALLAGVLGILIAAPTIASARVLGRYIYASLLDRDPFADSVISAAHPPNPRWWRRALSSGPADMTVNDKIQ